VTTGLVRIRCEHFGVSVLGFDEVRAELARCSPLEIVGAQSLVASMTICLFHSMP